ncbi:MAG TPA: twin-arginine translocation signal domain-containing protein, partial [Puia sp.]|nr:twin-arginine translocation signal domain-containing protein [Puia sp.]
MKKEAGRRKFLKTLTAGGLGMAAVPASLLNAPDSPHQSPQDPHRPYNSPYTGEHLNRIAFPIGGIG